MPVNSASAPMDAGREPVRPLDSREILTTLSLPSHSIPVQLPEGHALVGEGAPEIHLQPETSVLEQSPRAVHRSHIAASSGSRKGKIYPQKYSNITNTYIYLWQSERYLHSAH
jgi:hypothetical protein